MANHDASIKTMIITTPMASADRMTLVLGEWFGALRKISAIRTTQNAATATATAGAMTSSSRRERTGQSFSPRRDVWCAGDGPVGEYG
jgi:hypothetical protein